MQLRPRQSVFVDRVCEALDSKGNTLGVAPTGAGKTVMLSAVAARLKGNGLILQHRDELVTQNARTFVKMNPGTQASLYTADTKRWAREGWTFGMIQSVANGLNGMPILNNIIVDEAHHATSNTYLKVIGEAKRINPDVKVLGVTATPIRGDKRTLAAVWDNVADVITIRELIESGFLVKPRTYVVDVGVQQELREVRKLASDFDMGEVAAIMDKTLVTEKVVERWKELAGDRQTVCFAATVEHANHVAAAFNSSGVSAAVVTGEMPDSERQATLAAFDRRKIQVLVNVAVLTEGWDCQPASCCVLLRPSSFKSTMIQMVGRVLRVVDPERYPGVTKHDAIVIDFGTSILTHGSIETDGSLGEGALKDCPQCTAKVPAVCPECPLCGYAFPKPPVEVVEKDCPACGHANHANRRTCSACGTLMRDPEEREQLTDFVLTEIDLFRDSPFQWEELWPGIAYVCSSFDAWAAVVNYRGEWFTVAGSKENGIRCLAAGTERLIALSAGDDHMREHGSTEEAGKTKRWLSQPPSDKQLAHLKLSAMEAMGITRYRAACLMTWKWAESAIRSKIVAAAGQTQNLRAA